MTDWKFSFLPSSLSADKKQFLHETGTLYSVRTRKIAGWGEQGKREKVQIATSSFHSAAKVKTIFSQGEGDKKASRAKRNSTHSEALFASAADKVAWVNRHCSCRARRITTSREEER